MVPSKPMQMKGPDSKRVVIVGHKDKKIDGYTHLAGFAPYHMQKQPYCTPLDCRSLFYSATSIDVQSVDDEK